MKSHLINASTVFAGLLLASPLLAADVTFRINMSVQTSLGLFDPAADIVVVAGEFNGWSTSAGFLTQSSTDPAIFEGTFDAGAVGTAQNYKFVKNRSEAGIQWENDGLGPGGAQNRSVQIVSDPQTLDVVYFNNITNTVLNVTPVTFQIDMSVQTAQGAFDPSGATVTVAGAPLNDWNPTASPLVQSPGDSNVWVGTFNVTNPVASIVAYKFLMNGVWESIPNRNLVLQSGTQTLPIAFFNNVSNTPSSVPLTFQVNMGVQMARGNFNPAGDIVEARGSFLTDEGGNWLGGFVLTNDAANPIIYQGTWLDTNASPGGVIQYQFALNNGATWETTGNRVFTIPGTDPATVPLASFNNVADLGTVAMGPILNAQTTLSWTGGPSVYLQSADSLNGPWQDVAATQGQSSANVTVGLGTQYFRLRGP